MNKSTFICAVITTLGLLISANAYAAKICITIENPNTGDVTRDCYETDDIDTSWQNWGSAAIRAYIRFFMPEPDASGGIDYESAYPVTEIKQEGRFNLSDVGNSCTTTSGTPGIVTAKSVGGYGYGSTPITFYLCFEDFDGDGIININDDCPFDSTNTDEGCMNDLPDCDTLIASAFGVVSGAFGITSAAITFKYAMAGTVMTATAIKVVAASGLAGVVIATGAATYCAISELEN